MRLLNVLFLGLPIAAAACATTVREETQVAAGPAGAQNVSSQTSLNGRVLDQLRSQWAAETLEVTQRAPVGTRYGDGRDMMAARETARLLAAQELARQVGQLRLTEDTRLDDFQLSQSTRSRLTATLTGAYVVNERLIEASPRQYEVTLGLPKLTVLTVIRESVGY